MPSQQQRCEKGLREWRRAFLAIQQPRSKIEAVNRLCRFALEMRAYWPDTSLPGNGTDPAAKAEPFLPPPPITPDAVMLPPKPEPAMEPEKLVDFPGVVRVTLTEAPAVTHAAIDPAVVEIFVHSVCPNARLLSGRLPDGKPVAVWKGPHTWRLPCKKFCRKDTNSPNYTPV